MSTKLFDKAHVDLRLSDSLARAFVTAREAKPALLQKNLIHTFNGASLISLNNGEEADKNNRSEEIAFNHDLAAFLPIYKVLNYNVCILAVVTKRIKRKICAHVEAY